MFELKKVKFGLGRARTLSAAMSAIALALASTAPTYAAITNTATASGSYGVTPVTSAPDAESVTVTPAVPGLTIAKTAAAPDLSGGSDATNADAGDTITYTYVVTNDGNVTLDNVLPVDTGPTFHGEAGTGTMGAFTPTVGAVPVTLVPGASVTFTAVYTMSAADVFNAAGETSGVSNTASVEGETPAGTPFDDPDDSTATSTIPAFPNLTIVKTSDTAGPVSVGNTITYTYEVTNSGNVAITDVSINDTHEGAPIGPGLIVGENMNPDGPLASQTNPIVSTDAAPNDGTWSVLQPGAVVTFTYVHTVTQTEVDDQ